MLETKSKKIILASVLLVAIVFISYISIQSFWADIHYRQAKELAKNMKNWLEAATEYQKAISISPANADYYDEAGQLYSKISLLYQDGEWFEKTVSSFQESYRLNPYNAWAHYHLAWAHWNKKMYPEAEGESKKAILLDPNNATYHWQLAAVYEAMSRTEEAIAEYEEVLRIKPGHTKAKQAVKRVEERI